MGLGHSPSIITNGLVLCLDAGNTRSYAGSGTTWTDLSGNGNHGTMTSINYVTSNKSILFDDLNDTIRVPHSSSLNFNSVFTVSSFNLVNSFSTNTIYNVVGKKPNFNSSQKGWSCQYDYRSIFVLQYRNNDSSTFNDSTPGSGINLNNTALLNQTTNWVNTVWVISGSTVTFYINGIKISAAAVTYTNTDTSNDLYIGKITGSTGDPSLLMNLSSIKIYNRALSDQEVKQNFNALRGRFGI